ncbi:hypothetical protein SETIT_7G025200v2 [Setaria italica]|uniref:Uncharacterized protein n=1 Tax=Setaria italica TaxID=4555 RepID=A0A368RRE2_SETIT|nr:hypothetical protein SETIT_7G025200v2 [Setaria italica]
MQRMDSYDRYLAHVLCRISIAVANRMDITKMGKTRMMKTISLILLLIILAASQENMGVSVVQAACNINPYRHCAAVCLRPGHCDSCCKSLGYPRGLAASASRFLHCLRLLQLIEYYLISIRYAAERLMCFCLRKKD